MVCLQFEGAREAAADLNAQGIVIDWRPDCGIRVSMHYYNTDDEVERFFSALDTHRRTVDVDVEVQRPRG